MKRDLHISWATLCHVGICYPALGDYHKIIFYWISCQYKYKGYSCMEIWRVGKLLKITIVKLTLPRSLGALLRVLHAAEMDSISHFLPNFAIFGLFGQSWPISTVLANFGYILPIFAIFDHF